jgi:hypothetical protein
LFIYTGGEVKREKFERVVEEEEEEGGGAWASYFYFT